MQAFIFTACKNGRENAWTGYGGEGLDPTEKWVHRLKMQKGPLGLIFPRAGGRVKFSRAEKGYGPFG